MKNNPALLAIIDNKLAIYHKWFVMTKDVSFLTNEEGEPK